jgi:hypothetical protein
MYFIKKTGRMALAGGDRGLYVYSGDFVQILVRKPDRSSNYVMTTSTFSNSLFLITIPFDAK